VLGGSASVTAHRLPRDATESSGRLARAPASTNATVMLSRGSLDYRNVAFRGWRAGRKLDRSTG
jgi:hypothetical protein